MSIGIDAKPQLPIDAEAQPPSVTSFKSPDFNDRSTSGLPTNSSLTTTYHLPLSLTTAPHSTVSTTIMSALSPPKINTQDPGAHELAGERPSSHKNYGQSSLSLLQNPPTTTSPQPPKATTPTPANIPPTPSPPQSPQPASSASTTKPPMAKSLEPRPTVCAPRMQSRTK